MFHFQIKLLRMIYVFATERNRGEVEDSPAGREKQRKKDERKNIKNIFFFSPHFSTSTSMIFNLLYTFISAVVSLSLFFTLKSIGNYSARTKI